MTPPGLSPRSRAAVTGTSIPSSMPNPPSHSETITSTRSVNSTSRMSPWITCTTSSTPFAAASCCARTATDVCSTAYTRARTRARREQAEDAAARLDIENDVTGTHHRVDRPPERLGAHRVADHRSVHLELRVHRVRIMLDRRPHPLNVNGPPVPGTSTPVAAEPATRVFGLSE